MITVYFATTNSLYFVSLFSNSSSSLPTSTTPASTSIRRRPPSLSYHSRRQFCPWLLLSPIVGFLSVILFPDPCYYSPPGFNYIGLDILPAPGTIMKLLFFLLRTSLDQFKLTRTWRSLVGWPGGRSSRNLRNYLPPTYSTSPGSCRPLGVAADSWSLTTLWTSCGSI